jgi:hypothetical protein
LRKLSLAAALAIIGGVIIPVTLGWAPAQASPSQQYSGPYFGVNNFPPDCVRNVSYEVKDDCFRIKTDLNALDSPQIDVLVMVPLSPAAERDMRIMRQSIEMWEEGIDYLAAQMELPWLHEGVDFHVTLQYIDPAGNDSGEFTTYPIVDPEIVVIATNPVGGAGIGIDPPDFLNEGGLTFVDPNGVPCHSVANPLDFEYWDSLPGFNNHHGRSGTYTEDCDGSGGNICFAINGAIDPEPNTIDFFNLFDLVSHEFGHCLTLGHVGDGGEDTISGQGWRPVPTNDIMSYNTDPPGLNKCVSTLDVEAFAIRMSNFLDVDGDGAVTEADRLFANDQVGQSGKPFQVQRAEDHLYASSTGSPMDCPQPDLGLVPGERTEWTPEPAHTHDSTLTVTSPADGSTEADNSVTVTGTVENVALMTGPPPPTDSTGSAADPSDDASTAQTEILDLAVAATPEGLSATISLEDLWPDAPGTSAMSYSLHVNGKSFHSFIRYTDLATSPHTWEVKTWDGTAYLPGASSWDRDAKTVTFNLPTTSVTSPYYVTATANIGNPLGVEAMVADDTVPDSGEPVGVASARVIDLGVAEHGSTVIFEHEGGNTFYPEESTLGVTNGSPVDTSHHFTLPISEPSQVEFTLTWTHPTSDLDLYIGENSDGATGSHPEKVTIPEVTGDLALSVTPFLIQDDGGVTYTLTAVVAPLGGAEADSDGDGVFDTVDACPQNPGIGEDGCTHLEPSQVKVFVNGTLAGTDDVVANYEADRFEIPVTIDNGANELRVEWVDGGVVVASQTLSVTGPAADTDPEGPDTDGYGVTDAEDNCPTEPNSGQENLDGDSYGDDCDSDIDGDGFANGRERAQGSDPRDPESTPEKRKR